MGTKRRTKDEFDAIYSGAKDAPEKVGTVYACAESVSYALSRITRKRSCFFSNNKDG